MGVRGAFVESPSQEKKDEAGYQRKMLISGEKCKLVGGGRGSFRSGRRSPGGKEISGGRSPCCMGSTEEEAVEIERRQC